MSINWNSKAEENRFPDGVVTNTISELSSGSGTTVDGVLIKDNSINLGHANSTVLSYFEEYTNSSDIVGNVNTTDSGKILAGDLHIQRINNHCHLWATITTFVSATATYEDFTIPSRFRPTSGFSSDRQMWGVSANDPFVYIQVGSGTNSLRVGKTNLSGTLVAWGTATVRINIVYYLE